MGMLKRLKKSKTAWLVVVVIGGAVQQWMTDKIGSQEAVLAVIGGLYALFNRDAQAKGGRV